MRISSKWGLALAAAVLSTGCYGSFALTKKLHAWNGSVCGTEGWGSKWGNEVVFLITGVILPVYGICVFIDGLIINSIEFWTGNNPMNSVTVSKLDDSHDLRMEKVAENQIKVEILEAGLVIGTYTLDRTESGTVMHDVAGNEVAAAATRANGEVSLVAAR